MSNFKVLTETGDRILLEALGFLLLEPPKILDEDHFPIRLEDDTGDMLLEDDVFSGLFRRLAVAAQHQASRYMGAV